MQADRTPKPDKNKKREAKKKPEQNKSTGFMPCSIVFLSGSYKGKSLDLGVAINESQHDQSATWDVQEGHSIRVGANFKSISSRTFSLKLEFYSLNEDISKAAENIATIQEIDDETGSAPTLLYREGDTQVAPVVCKSFRIHKEHPFPGRKGFHFAAVDVSLELLGGKTSEHRFAKPLVDTELMEERAKQTKAEREKQGTVAVAQQVLAKCLKPQENEQITELLQANAMDDPERLKGLSASALVQAATAGLIKAPALAQIRDRLRSAIAVEIARKTDGVGNNANALAQAIIAPAGTALDNTLPADLRAEVSKLQGQLGTIEQAIAEQQLGESDPVFARGETANQLINIAACGMRMRSAGGRNASNVSANVIPPKWEAYFNQKLGEQAKDQAAREKLITEEINKTLNDKDLDDSEIQIIFGLSSVDQAKALRNGKPYANKDAFVKRAGETGLEGLGTYATFVDYKANLET